MGSKRPRLVDGTWLEQGGNMRDRVGIGWWLGLLVGWPIWLFGAGAVAEGVTGRIVDAVPFPVPALANRVLGLVVVLVLAYAGARVLRALKAPTGIFVPLVVSTIIPLVLLAIFSISTGGQLDVFIVVYEFMYVATVSLGAWLGSYVRPLRAEATA